MSAPTKNYMQQNCGIATEKFFFECDIFTIPAALYRIFEYNKSIVLLCHVFSL